MYAQMEKSKESKSRAVANNITQKQDCEKNSVLQQVGRHGSDRIQQNVLQLMGQEEKT
jgi:hypothetical protein